MNIYCINLDRALDRKEYITKRWIENLGLNITFWSAYDRRKIENGESYFIYDKDLSQKIIGRPLSTGEIACATSFYQLFEFILKNNIQECIIMEDDAIPLVTSKDIIFDSINKSKLEFPSLELLLMHKISPIQENNHNKWIIPTYNDIFNVKKDVSSLCKRAPWGNQCFYITKKGVDIAWQHLIKNSNAPIIAYPADYFATNSLCPQGLVTILNNPICDHDWIGKGSTTYIGNELRGTHRKFMP